MLQACAFHQDKEEQIPLGPNYISIRKNIFEKKGCLSCHSADGKAHDTPLEPLDELLRSPKELVINGNPDESGLYLSIISLNEKKRMPPPKSGPRLPDIEIELIRKWIEIGAPERN